MVYVLNVVSFNSLCTFCFKNPLLPAMKIGRGDRLIITKTFWGHRWCETAVRCVWVSDGYRRAGLTLAHQQMRRRRHFDSEHKPHQTRISSSSSFHFTKSLTCQNDNDLFTSFSGRQRGVTWHVVTHCYTSYTSSV